MVLLFLTAFFLNVLTITYYVLFDDVAIGCMRMPKALEYVWGWNSSLVGLIWGRIASVFRVVVCLSTHLPAQHHTIYCALFLTLLHFLAFAASMVRVHYVTDSASA